MREILIPLGCVALGLLLIASEVFVPSAGIIGILATISLVSGVVLAFYYGGMVTGAFFMMATLAVVVAVLYQVFRWWPHTWIGKQILIEPAAETILVDRSEYQNLVGQVGKTAGVMMPGGYVEIEGKRYDAVAEVAIEDGQWITVTGLAAGSTLKVRSISEQAAHRELRRQQPDAVDRLSRPVENGFEDPFDEP